MRHRVHLPGRRDRQVHLQIRRRKRRFLTAGTVHHRQRGPSGPLRRRPAGRPRCGGRPRRWWPVRVSTSPLGGSDTSRGTCGVASTYSIRMLERLREHRGAIREVLAKYGASDPRLIGSVVQGTAGPHSDVDLLLDLTAGGPVVDSRGYRVSGWNSKNCSKSRSTSPAKQIDARSVD